MFHYGMCHLWEFVKGLFKQGSDKCAVANSGGHVNNHSLNDGFCRLETGKKLTLWM